MSQPILVYSPDFALHHSGEISLRGNSLIHHLPGQELVDPVYTVAKLRYPYPVPGRVPNPEQPARVTNAFETLQAFELVGPASHQLRLVNPRPASLTELIGVHTAAHVNRVIGLSQAGGGELGESTYIGAGSYQIAALAAGAGLTAAESIFQGAARSALVLTRPPGHHAGRDHAAGFCIFNNVAVLANYCRAQGAERVLILDWDLHHGDGTQEIFYDNPQVLYCSFHQFGPELYPEKGDFAETGAAAGAGFSVNLPLPAKTGDDTFLPLFGRVTRRLCATFRPDIILVSAGYDTHFNDTQNLYVWDPEGGFSLSALAYANLTQTVAQAAAQYCQGRYVIVLEGGYNLYNLAAGLVNTAAAMLGYPAPVSEQLPAAVPVAALDLGQYLHRLDRHHPQFGFLKEE